MKKILVTGSSGFIGSFLVEGGLEREFQVWAGVRTEETQTSARWMGLYHSLCGGNQVSG